MTPSDDPAAQKLGMAPGSVVFTGERRMEEVRVTRAQYHSGVYDIADVEAPQELAPPGPDQEGVTWINVYGLHDTELVSALGASFEIHPLALEDVVNVRIRPQTAAYDGHVFASVRMLSLDESDEFAVLDEHIALILGPNWVLSFQEREGDVFDPVRERLERGTTRIRTRGADYLWYALIDCVVDHYGLVVAELMSEAEELERLVWEEERDNREIPEQLQWIRQRALIVRRAVRPLREVVDTVLRDPSPEISETTLVFMGDLREHIAELAESLETIRDMLSAVMDAHLTLLSTRANDVMKVLTIVATIFIPITFIAGVYGMNFQHMPELAFPWAYGAIWIVMISVAGLMVAFFRRRGWL